MIGTSARLALGVVTAWAGSLAVQRSLVRVRGGSMSPTLEPDDVVLTVPLGTPRRGQVVLVRDPRDGTHLQVKRILGLPGEELRAVDGRVLVDGVGQVEPYARGRGPDGRLAVPAGHVAVLGDARDSSTDSRSYGPVPLDLVGPRVVARVTPRPRVLTERPHELALAPDGVDAA